MKRVLALAALAIFFWQGSAKADLIPGSQTTVAGWEMGAYATDGKFTHCSMSAGYKSGIHMFFYISGDFSWRIGWAHSGWRFKTGQGVDLALFVDNAGPIPLHAKAKAGVVAIAELPVNAALFDLIRNGNSMTVRAVGNTYAFNLNGTYAALTEILKCTQRHTGAASNPLGTLASSSNSPQPPRPPAATAPKQQPIAHGLDRLGKSTAIQLVLGDGVELKPQAVFEKASGAVYVVTVGENLGSAVAIGERELLTNCHVVENATAVTLEREGIQFPATLISANSTADRCVLKISDTVAPLPKWVRVRPYADVRVGERVFSIGAPRGLELSLAEGIVSSKRVEDKERVFQTSAPISPGSSGGGLFDAQGNLIGITTFMIEGGQNLNFAIAAEEYAK